MVPANDPRRRVSKGSRGGAEVPAAGGARPEVTPNDSGKRVSNQGVRSSAAVPRPPEGGAIRGRVVSQSRQPVSGATVAIKGGPVHRDIARVTDEQGEFVLGGLLPGDYQVEAGKGGYTSGTARVTVPTNRVITVVLRQQP
jgi:Carboxypeptidase regulatory-like domain